MRAYALLVVTVVVACTHNHEPVVRYLSRVESQPRAAAPGAQHRLLATRADGAKEYALVLARGDEKRRDPTNDVELFQLSAP